MKTILDLRTDKQTKVPLKEAMEDVRKDIGDKLYNQLNWEDKKFIAKMEGSFTYSETLFNRILIKFGLRKCFYDRVIKKLK